MRRWISIILTVILITGGLTACKKGQRTVTLYFREKDTEFLRKEKRVIPGQEMEKETVLALMEGPRTEGLEPVIPEGTKLLGIEMKGKVAVLNFSRELRDNHWGGSSGEAQTVYSLANTLSDLPTVERIKILLEGREVDSLLGHIYLGEEIERNDDIVKE